MSIDLSGILDLKIVIVLWCLGYFLKHTPINWIRRISASVIPVVLTGTGVIMACILATDVTFNAILIGFTSAMFAVGIHSSGKNIFKMFSGTTVYVTPESLSNSTAKQESYKNNTATINTEISNNYSEDGVVVQDENEIIIDDGNSVG